MSRFMKRVIAGQMLLSFNLNLATNLFQAYFGKKWL